MFQECFRLKDHGIWGVVVIEGNARPAFRQYSRRGGRPGLNVDFVADCDAVLGARNGSGETMTDIANRFECSRAWLHKHVYPIIDGPDLPGI